MGDVRSDGARRPNVAEPATLPAGQAEAVHAELYQRALEAVEQGKDLAEAGFYLRIALVRFGILLECHA